MKFFKITILRLIALCILTALSESSKACIWDRETIIVEKSRFPKALELITGNFVRHSPEFYEWRKKNRLEQIQKNPSDPALYDDLAVSYEKLGDHDKAIETILLKESKFPGKYETYANLGTFYIHAGQLDRGLEQISKAIAINSNAHFGREIYQLRLCKYALSKSIHGKKSLPLSPSGQSVYSPIGFARFDLDEAAIGGQSGQAAEIAKAMKGVEGMMRFGNYDSPILLEALGDLILADAKDDGRDLAARAYLKASYACALEEERLAYRRKAANALFPHPEGAGTPSIQGLESKLRDGLEIGVKKYAKIREDEMEWIKAGKDPELETLKKYYPDPDISPSLVDLFPVFHSRLILFGKLIFCSISFFLFCGLLRFVSARRHVAGAGRKKDRFENFF